MTDDLIARLRGLRSMVGEIDQSIADLGEEAAEALAALQPDKEQHRLAFLDLCALKSWLEDCGDDENVVTCVARHIDRARRIATEQARDATEALAAASRPQERMFRANRFDCEDCGRGIAVDEDGCCCTCGASAVAVSARLGSAPPAAPPPWQPIEQGWSDLEVQHAPNAQCALACRHSASACGFIAALPLPSPPADHKE